MRESWEAREDSEESIVSLMQERLAKLVQENLVKKWKRCGTITMPASKSSN